MRAARADAGAIYLYDEEHGDLVLSASAGFGAMAPGHRVGVGEGLVGLVAEAGRSLVSDDVAADPRSRRHRPEWDSEPRVRAFLGLPLRTGRVIMGVLELVRFGSGPFDPDTRGQLSILADACALLVEQVRLARQPPPAALGDQPTTAEGLGLVALDSQLSVTAANPAFCRLVGIPLEALVGRPVLAVLPELGRPAARDALMAALHGSAGHVGTAVVPGTSDGRGDGSSDLTLALSVIPLGGADPESGAMLVASDLTDRARLEAELREKHSQAVVARDRLRAVVQVVTHELRTPLTSVLGYAQLILERQDAGADLHGRWAGVIQDKARIMARLIADITDLAKLGESRFELRPVMGDLGAFVAAVVGEAQSRTPHNRLVVHAEPAGPVVNFDPDRLTQVITNLLSNAVKYGPGRSDIDIAVSCDSDFAYVEVLDRGPGIPDALRAKVFEPFTRLDSSVGGSGLGLSIASGIVEAHGGTLTASDRPGGGSAFRVSLPLAQPKTAGAPFETVPRGAAGT